MSRLSFYSTFKSYDFRNSINMLSWVFMVLAHCNNNLQIELSLHSDTLYWLGTNLCFYSLILLVSGEAANTKFYSLWFDSGLNPGLTVLQWIEPRTYCAWVDWTQDLLFSSGLNPGLTVLEWIEPRTYCARVDWTQDLLCSRWKCYQLHHWDG